MNKAIGRVRAFDPTENEWLEYAGPEEAANGIEGVDVKNHGVRFYDMDGNELETVWTRKPSSSKGLLLTSIDIGSHVLRRRD